MDNGVDEGEKNSEHGQDMEREEEEENKFCGPVKSTFHGLNTSVGIHGNVAEGPT